MAEYAITFADVMSGAIGLGLGLVTFLLKRWFDNSFSIKLDGKLGAAFVTAQSALGGTDTAIMEILRHMLVKGMLIFSGTGDKTADKFQIGAVGMAKDMDGCAKQFEVFGGSVAEKAMELFGK